MQLLREEIEALAGAAAGASTRRTSATCVVSRASSSATSILVANSASSCFRRSSFGIEPGLAQARAELLDVGGVDRGNARRDARDLRLDVGAAGVEQHAASLAPSRARAAASSASACVDERRARVAASVSGATVGSASTPGQRRISLTDSGAAPGTAARHVGGGRGQLPIARGVDGERRARLAAVRSRATRHSTLPRFSARGERLAQRGLERAQLVGQLDA